MTISYLIISSLSLGLSYRSIEDSKEPFILSNGLVYRDVATLKASKDAAIFAHKYNSDRAEDPRESNGTGKYRILPDFVQKANFTFGERKSSSEIFDFLDSRFLNPPHENIRARPTFVESQVNSL